jgi:hypothetical protein
MEGYRYLPSVVRALADVVGAAAGSEGMEGMLACSVWNTYICLPYHTSSVMTTYTQISRVPACPGKLSDRQRETRKVGKEYLVLHTQSCPKAVAPRDRFITLDGPSTRRRGRPYFLPVYCCKTHVTIVHTLTLQLIRGRPRNHHWEWKTRGRLCCQRINAASIITAAPPALRIRGSRTRRRGRDGY